MSREVRRVPENWQHPQYALNRYEPLFDSEGIDFSDPEIISENYMPDWADAERTHLQIYETTSEGTPLTPPMATAEELADYCVRNGISAFAGMTATYEQWLAMINTGYSLGSMSCLNGELISGVAAVSDK